MMETDIIRVMVVIIYITTNHCKPTTVKFWPKIKATTTVHFRLSLNRKTSVSLAEGYEEGESRETSVVMGRRSSTSSSSVSPWEDWLEQALQALQSSMLLRSLRPLVPSEVAAAAAATGGGGDCKSPRATGNDTPSFQTFQGLGTWDRAAVEVEVSHATFQCWNQESPSTGSFVASSSSRWYLSLCLGFFCWWFLCLSVFWKFWRSMTFFLFFLLILAHQLLSKETTDWSPRARAVSFFGFRQIFFVTDDVQIVRQVRRCAISRMSWTFHHQELLPRIPATSCDSSLGMIIWAFLSIRLSAVPQLRYRRRGFTWCQPIFFSLKLKLQLK
jgi:hypothetical protein